MKTADQRLRDEIKLCNVADLYLDPENPRLPEELNGKPQSKLLRYLYDNATLEELARSFLDNGFFTHEPLIVLPVRKGTKTRYTVLEGNRRLAALMILHSRSEANGIEFDLEPTDQQLAEIQRVPCYSVSTRDEVYRFLGFRHIGGLKTWSSEAKARYLAREVDSVGDHGNAFQEVGKRVGSNALGVRNYYIAISTLRYAKDELGISTKGILQDRFGVWLRCMNSPDIRGFIGFGEAVTLKEVRKELRKLKADGLRQVVGDLSRTGESKAAILEDSRDVTDYGRILKDARALKLLREHHDFELARRVVEGANVPNRVRRLATECKALIDEIDEVEHTDDLDDAINALFKNAKLLRLSYQSNGTDGDSD